MRDGRGEDESGQVAVLVLGLALVVMAVAVDGTRAFLARRTLQNAADAAALAGAAELDETTVYASGGRTLVLDPQAARAVAADWLARRGLRVDARMAADRARVEVTLRDRVRTTFLALIGLSTLPVAADASAEPIAYARTAGPTT
jgi:Flp pilus assembly protein TadG